MAPARRLQLTPFSTGTGTTGGVPVSAKLQRLELELWNGSGWAGTSEAAAAAQASAGIFLEVRPGARAYVEIPLGIPGSEPSVRVAGGECRSHVLALRDIRHLAMQRCIEEVLAEGGSAELLKAQLVRCAESAGQCLEAALGTQPLAAAAKACAITEQEEDLVAAFWSQLWQFLGWYNALQLVIIPWVFLWMFSSAVLGLARFARFQYQLLRISVDTLLLMALSVLTDIEDGFTWLFRQLHGCFSQRAKKRLRLERDLKRAPSFAEFRRAEEALPWMEAALSGSPSSAALGAREIPGSKHDRQGGPGEAGAAAGGPSRRRGVDPRAQRRAVFGEALSLPESCVRASPRSDRSTGVAH
ncbi:unnamed protein product [Effrenium voratum]|nr:unnamed protein product [Effrenium voratum]